MYFLTVERANKAEISISTAREQKSLGKIGVRHDWYYVTYKVFVCWAVGHFWPASVGLTSAFFLQRYCDFIVL